MPALEIINICRVSDRKTDGGAASLTDIDGSSTLDCLSAYDTQLLSTDSAARLLQLLLLKPMAVEKLVGCIYRQAQPRQS